MFYCIIYLLHISVLLSFFFLILHFSLERPHIVDPANPTNNLYDDVNCWPEVEKVAEESMRKPLLRDVRVTDDWSLKNHYFV